MAKIENIFKKLLPEAIKAPIRPAYLRLKKEISGLFCKGAPPIRIETYGGFEIAFTNETSYEDVIGQKLTRDCYFSSIPEYKIAEDHIIIDVGAHIGTFSILASSKLPRGKVYSIEPCQDSFNLLRINIALNKATNISAHHLALSDKKGTITLYYNLDNWGHSVVKHFSKRSEIVNTCSLSDFMKDNNIEKCHFMKLNCEGAEFPILLNTQADILKRFEAILVLYHCDFWTANTEQDLESYLKSSGFETTIIPQTKKRGSIVAVNKTRIPYSRIDA